MKKLILGITSLLFFYFLAAFILSIISTRPPHHSCHARKTIYIQTNGVHLNIILPREYLKDSRLRDLIPGEEIQYMAFGWGDKGFYLNTPEWKDLRFGVAVKALFIKSTAAMHVIHYYRKLPKWYPVLICQAQLDEVNEFILSSFQIGENAVLKKIPESGYTPYDHFYEAHGSYTMFYTSNNWVNEALKHADVKTAVWSPFDKGVLYHVQIQP